MLGSFLGHSDPASLTGAQLVTGLGLLCAALARCERRSYQGAQGQTEVLALESSTILLASDPRSSSLQAQKARAAVESILETPAVRFTILRPSLNELFDRLAHAVSQNVDLWAWAVDGRRPSEQRNRAQLCMDADAAASRGWQVGFITSVLNSPSWVPQEHVDLTDLRLLAKSVFAVHRSEHRHCSPGALRRSSEEIAYCCLKTREGVPTRWVTGSVAWRMWAGQQDADLQDVVLSPDDLLLAKGLSKHPSVGVEQLRQAGDKMLTAVSQAVDAGS